MRSPGEPESALVLLHGRGTDELDLLPLADRLDPEGRLAVVVPRAPLSLPPGGYHWYVVGRVGFPEPQTFFDSFGRLAEWLDALPEAIGVPWERTVLGGFSMGAVMSYALGLGTGRPAPAGIVALSGFLPTVEGLELDLGHRQGLPVAIGHGTEDPVISVDFAREARRRLEEAGLAVLYREAAVAHTIEPSFVAELRVSVAVLASGALVPQRRGRPARAPGVSAALGGSWERLPTTCRCTE